jgi:hypothetical protein
MPAQNVTVTANFAPFAGGSGTEGNPYQIADWYQLHNVRDYSDSHFILVNNLDSSTAGYTELASPTANGGKGWQPIGSVNITDPIYTEFEVVDPFTGTFDGQGYEIGDLCIDRPDENGVALFGAIDVGGVIEKVEMVDGDVTGGCYCVGGLVGMNIGTISDCYATGSVTGNYEVGGLVGWNEGTVSNSCSTGSVSGEGHVVGGLVGLNWYGTVNNSYSTGNVTGSHQVGGLVGGNSGNVSNSYATGNVTGEECVGGLVGLNHEGTVDSSYSTGNVTGIYSVGGLVGLVGNGNVSNSFWDTQTSGRNTSAGGTGKTTAQMQDITTFSGVGWDIIGVANSSTRNTSYIWNIVDDVTYPFLSWQPV